MSGATRSPSAIFHWRRGPDMQPVNNEPAFDDFGGFAQRAPFDHDIGRLPLDSEITAR